MRYDAMVKSFGQISPFRFWQRIGFCSIALRSWEFCKIGNLFVVMEFSATTNFANHPAGARDRETFIRRYRCCRSFFHANGCKMRKFRGYLRRVVRKLPASLCSFLLNHMHLPRYFITPHLLRDFTNTVWRSKKSIKVTLNSFNYQLSFTCKNERTFLNPLSIFRRFYFSLE